MRRRVAPGKEQISPRRGLHQCGPETPLLRWLSAWEGHYPSPVAELCGAQAFSIQHSPLLPPAAHPSHLPTLHICPPLTSAHPSHLQRAALDSALPRHAHGHVCSGLATRACLSSVPLCLTSLTATPLGRGCFSLQPEGRLRAQVPAPPVRTGHSPARSAHHPVFLHEPCRPQRQEAGLAVGVRGEEGGDGS